MAHKAGHEGRARLGSTTIEAHAWTLQARQVHHLRVPFYGGEYSVVAEDVAGWNGTITCWLNPSDSGQNSVLVIGATGTFTLYEDYSSNYWQGTGYITDIRQGSRVHAAQNFTISFVASGDWSRT